MNAKTLETTRLLLRHWKSSDLPLFYKINSNPIVMKHLICTLNKEQSDNLAYRVQKELDEKPYGFWAVELKCNQKFIGCIGLHYQDFNTHFAPCIEIGWRLDLPFWGQGYATEGAKYILDYGHNTLNIEEIVAYTSKNNSKSKKVMEKIGMQYDEKGDFLHPRLPKGHLASEQTLYRSLIPIT